MTGGRAMLYRPARPVALDPTLAPLAQGSTDPTIRRGPEGWWLAIRTEAGTASLLLRETSGGITARAWGDGADAALDSVPALLGARDDEGGFDASRHPLVRELHRRMPGLRLPATGRILVALLPSILGQKVTGIEAKRSWRELVTLAGEHAPGPAPLGLRVPPALAGWRGIPSWSWHRCGVTPQRADTIQRVLRVGDALERAATRSAAEAAGALRTVAGVGVWTAHETVQRTHGDPDRVSVGDLHLSRRVGAALLGDPALGRGVDDAAMLELLEPWRGHRQRVVRLIEAARVGYERRGPRFAIPAHRTR
ncbi:MAG: DNA-3-methyladenine glycosylase 2 family protein [Actinomycetales bacterium]|nr:DNA-3-methyladenine glycosylase 2 family protein [Actinomycetales bacterium]